jgi:hypothetical protein
MKGTRLSFAEAISAMASLVTKDQTQPFITTTDSATKGSGDS